MSKQIIATDNAPSAIGPYSQAVTANGFVFVSGCLGIDSKTGDFVSTNVTDQTRCALENMRAVLAAAGCTMDHVVKCSLFLADMADFGKVNAIYAEFFTEQPPARETIQAACLPKNGLFEISCIAALPQ
ncbi:hypothetical protein RCL1_002302 [Eukaryota sp. TZLM3-RCL]